MKFWDVVAAGLVIRNSWLSIDALDFSTLPKAVVTCVLMVVSLGISGLTWRFIADSRFDGTPKP